MDARPIETSTEPMVPDFDVLRGRADFQKLVAEVEAKAEKVPETTPPWEKK